MLKETHVPADDADDEGRSGRPTTTNYDQNVKKLKNMLMSDGSGKNVPTFVYSDWIDSNYF